jgi:hypothetical protein
MPSWQIIRGIVRTLQRDPYSQVCPSVAHGEPIAGRPSGQPTGRGYLSQYQSCAFPPSSVAQPKHPHIPSG